MLLGEALCHLDGNRQFYIVGGYVSMLALMVCLVEWPEDGLNLMCSL